MNQNQQNTQQNQWTDVTGGGFGTPWKPQATEENGMAFNPANPYNVLQGYFVKITEDIPTKYESPMTLYSIQTVNPDKTLGAIYSLTETKFLSDKMRAIPLYTYIRIEYKGKTLKKGLPDQNWSKTNSYHKWSIAADYNVLPLRPSVPAAAPIKTQQQQAPNTSGQQQSSGPFYPSQNQQQQAPPTQQNTWTPPAQQQQQAPPQNQQWAPQQQQNTFNPPPPAQNGFGIPPGTQPFTSSSNDDLPF